MVVGRFLLLGVQHKDWKADVQAYEIRQTEDKSRSPAQSSFSLRSDDAVANGTNAHRPSGHYRGRPHHLRHHLDFGK